MKLKLSKSELGTAVVLFCSLPKLYLVQNVTVQMREQSLKQFYHIFKLSIIKCRNTADDWKEKLLIPIVNEDTDEFRSGFMDGDDEIVLNWYGIGDSIMLRFWILNFKELEAEFSLKRSEDLPNDKEVDKGKNQLNFYYR